MNRRGSVYSLLVLTVLYTLFVSSTAFAGRVGGPAAETMATSSNPLWAPDLNLPDDSLVVACVADSICFEVSGVDPDPSDSLQLALISGPIDFQTRVFGYQFSTDVCFFADTSGVYTFVWELTDKQYHKVRDSVSFTLDLGMPPVVEDQYFYAELCDLREERFLQIEADDGGADLTFELVSGPGSIDPQSGLITYQPDTSGLFTFLVAVSNECGHDTATITDELVLNQPPYVFGFDSTVYLCDPEEICFNVYGFDPEGDEITITMLEGLGSFSQTSDTSGTACFIPADISYSCYEFVFHSADSCVSSHDDDLTGKDPQCCLDTVNICVYITQSGELSCPADTVIDLCIPPDELPGEICLPGFMSTWEMTTASIGTIVDGNLCFTPDRLGEFEITVIGSDSCDHADTCTTLITLRGNNVPQVVTAEDFEVSYCWPETICFDASVEDTDNDIVSIVSSYGTYDSVAGQVCFDADSSGVYTVILTATDACGVSAVDTTVVTVELNEPPVVSLGEDRRIDLCDPEEVCVDAVVTGSSITYITSNIGTYDSLTNQICFTPESSGRYEIILEAGDVCDNVVTDTAVIDVALNSLPVISGLKDTSIYLCYPEEICLDVDISDPDDDIESINVTGGTYADGQICFVPYNGQNYEITVTVTDSCGHVVEKTAVITVQTDQGVTIECPGDTTVFLCEPDTLCFPIVLGELPPGAEISVDGIGAWWNEETESICFFSDCCLENTLSVSVTTICGTYSCEFTVYVQTNSDPLIMLPVDTTVLLCDDEMICLPVGISDIDGNIADVFVDGGTYDAYDGLVCFESDGPGEYALGVTVVDSCGASRTDSMVVTVVLNSPPQLISLVEDSVFGLCEIEPVSLLFTYQDVDFNIDSIYSPDGEIMFSDSGNMGVLQYEAPGFGYQCANIIAVDKCGAADTLEICITLEQPPLVSIDCPEPSGTVICGPGEVCFPVTIEGDPIEVITSAGTWANGELCIHSDEIPFNPITIIAVGECNSDTCVTEFQIDVAEPPVVECPGDTTVFLCGPDTLVFEVMTSGGHGPTEQLSAEPPAWITRTTEGDFVNLPVYESGEQLVTVIYSNPPCEPDSCSFTVTAEFNSPPVVDIEGLEREACELEEVCVPFWISDIDNNIDTIFSSVGTIEQSFRSTGSGVLARTDMFDDEFRRPGEEPSGYVCFTPDSFGSHEIVLTVRDDCGAEDSKTVTVTITEGGWAEIACPDISSPITYCDPGSHCIDLVITGHDFTVSTNYGTWADNQLCFDLDTAGVYEITTVAEAECGVDTCTMQFALIAPAEVVCGVADTNIFLCEEESQLVRIPVEIYGDNVEVTVSPDNAELVDGFVEVPVSEAGVIQVLVEVSNECSEDACSFTITVETNTPPQLTLGDDVVTTACEPEQICVPYSVADANNNVVEIRSTLGIINDSMVCYTPPDFGEYEIVVTVTDSCGAWDKDTVHITVEPGQYVTMTCPDTLMSVAVDVPDTVRIPVGIDPVDVDVTVAPSGYFDAGTGEVVVYIESTGRHTFEITATAECNVEICEFTLDVGQYIPPMVDCISTLDTVLCLVGVDTLCVPVEIYGSDIQVEVTEPAWYADGFVCLPVEEAGEYVVDIIAFNDRDTASCTSTLVVTGGNPPVVEMPESLSANLCEPGEICFEITVEDTDFDIVSMEPSYGVYDPESGTICFEADTTGVYVISFTVVDECGNEVSDETRYTVDLNAAPVVDLGDDIALFICETEEVCVNVGLTNDDDEAVTVNSNIGLWSEATSEVCFTADMSGTYTLIVSATDYCGLTSADTLLVDVDVNEPPVVSMPADSSVYLCYPREICINVGASDPDNNLTDFTVTGGDYSDGQVCFVPYNQGTYEIIGTAVDECGATTVDTTIITVETDQAIVLECPGDTTVFLCEPDTVCFPVHIEGLPEGAEVEVGGIGTWWDAETESICFFSDCCLENNLSVTVNTVCGSYNCEFTVSIQTNSRPLVLLPKDTTIVQCELAEVCVPVGISDIDGNVMNVTAEGGTYDDYRSEVCFVPDTSGVYTITVTAEDSCYAYYTDTAFVTITVNQPPVISYTPIDTVYRQCEPTEICLPVDISDPDNNLTGVEVEGGWYDAEAGLVCLTPDGIGTFCVTVTATDICGLTDVREICVETAEGYYVQMTCPEPFEEEILCEPAEVCLPLEIIGEQFVVFTDYGQWADNELCFMVDTTGLYTITVTAEAQCNTEVCVVTIPINIPEPISLTCPENDEAFVCGPDTLCYEFFYAPASADVAVSEPAFLSEGHICVPVLEPGSITVDIIVSNVCDADTCSFTVTAAFNSPPVVVMGDDVNLTECSLHDICIPVTLIADPDGNLASITVSHGALDDDMLLCFTPPDYGQYEIVVTAVDECEAVGADTVVVTITEGGYAEIDCPDGTQYASVCGADSVCLQVSVSPDDADVTVLPNGSYNHETHEICIWISEGGTQEITVIAAAQCGSDTCIFDLAVDFGIPPEIVCPGEIDTVLCLVEEDTLRYPITVTGTGVNVNVNPIGFYSSGVVSVPISEPGEYEIEVIAFGACGADTCVTLITVNPDLPPELIVPEYLTFERCPDDTDVICIDGIYVSDTESDDVVVSMVCGPGEFTPPGDNSGKVCFLPDSFGEFLFCFEADDGCHVVPDTMIVEITMADDCDVCLSLSIDGGSCTPVGLRKEVALNIETNDRIGGFDILLSYDASALSFQNATMDNGAGESWEYFTWSLNAVSTGTVRFVGIADRNNGGAHPPDSAYDPDGTLIFIEFQVANDQNLGGVFVPINFVWYDCTDNSFSDPSGSVLFIDSRIYSAEEELIWDEFDDVAYPDEDRPFGMGAPDSCIVETEKTEPLRCIEFVNGGICIIDPDSIDARGDINLNGLSYEIADAVVFTNYFIKGMSAFSISMAGQIAATDVNADGLTLTVADLALLIRVIVGDADPVPKTTPYADQASVYTSFADGELTIGAETVDNLGTAYFIFDIDPSLTFGLPEATEATAGFDIEAGVLDGQLRVLMYDIGTSVVESGRHDLITLPVHGEGDIRLVHSELVDYHGQPYQSSGVAMLPAEFALEQNYPNPFNPTTTIGFAMPQAGAWTLRIYNVTGALVWETSGSSAGGREEVIWDGRNANGETTASGVYFYRLDASAFSETKKMILLK